MIAVTALIGVVVLILVWWMFDAQRNFDTSECRTSAVLDELQHATESFQYAITQLQDRNDQLERRLTHYFQQQSTQQSRMDSFSITLSVLDQRTNQMRYEFDLFTEDTEADCRQMSEVLDDIKIGPLGEDE